MMCGFEDVETCERNIQKFVSVTVFFSNPKVISKVVIRNIQKRSAFAGLFCFAVGFEFERRLLATFLCIVATDAAFSQ